MPKFLEWLNTFVGTKISMYLETLILLVLGLILIKLVSKITKVGLRRTEIEGTMASFIVSITSFILNAILVFLVISSLKINTGSLIAAIGAAGLAIALALQGSLSNFANGIVIIFTKPFREGDFVEIGTISGKVRAIKMLTTELVSVDNKKIVLTNTKVISSDIVNHSIRPTRRVDLKFGVAYNSDVELASSILKQIALDHPKILNTPQHIIRMAELGESSVNFIFKVWVANSDYWDVYYDVTEQVYAKFTDAGISIPFRQVDVHVISDNQKDKK